MIIKADYKQLSKSEDGQKVWEGYMSQIMRIALQYPNHFKEEIAQKAIPQDASNHHCYLYLYPDGSVVAFCVLIKTFLEAELLWLAVDKKYSRKGIGTSLVKKIESNLYCEDSSIIQIIGKATAPDSKLPGTEIGGKLWKGTISFYKSLGYEFQYKMEDYWHTGNHVAFFAKRHTESIIGYDRLEDFSVDKLQTDFSSNDWHLKINQSIQENIRDYLRDLFLEATKIEDPVERFSSATPLRKGFVGIVFMPQGNHATIFANCTEKSHKIQVEKYEYEIQQSALISILANSNLPNTGVVLYQNAYDTDSQIKINDYFLNTPDLQASEEGYSLFYHRNKNKKYKSMVCFYFLCPARKNVIVEKRNWREFSKGSSMILLGLSSLLWTISQEENFSPKKYLKSLSNCIDLPEKLKKYSIYFRSVFSMALRLKAIAKHSYTTAHPLKTRIRQLATEANNLFYSILDVKNNKKSFKELQEYAKQLQVNIERNFEFASLSHMLHSAVVQGYEKTLLSKNNNDEFRFATNLELRNIRSLIEETFGDILIHKNKEIQIETPNNIEMNIKGYFSNENQSLRPNDSFYREIFMEILSNAVKFGTVGGCTKEDKATVRLTIENKLPNSCREPLLIFSNYAIATDSHNSPFLKKPKDTWFNWNTSNPTGLSFIAKLLDLLNAGHLLCKYSDCPDISEDVKLFRVGVCLYGLTIQT